MKKGFYKRSLTIVMAAAMAASLMACGQSDTSDGAADTAGESSADTSAEALTQEAIDPDTVMMKVEDTEVSAYELFYFYAAAKTYYEDNGYVTDWTEAYSDDMTLGDYLKTITQEQVLELEYYVLNADQYNVELSDEDKETAASTAAEYVATLDQDIIDFYGLNEENMTKVAEKYAIANAVYTELIAEKEAALTDEEKDSCQYREIQHILISTMDGPEAETSSDADGESEAETQDSEALAAEQEAYMQEQYATAEEVLAKAKAGEDFETLANEYTADSGVTYYINDDGETLDGATMVSEFTEAAVALEDGEISDIVQTDYGYHIIKCVTTNDEDSTAQAIENLAASKASEDYQTWYATTPYEYMDVWTNYVVTNPAADEEEETTVDDAAAEESTADDTAANDAASDDSAAQDAAADDGAAEDTATDDGAAN